MRVILVDDESLALDYLGGLLKKIDGVQIVGKYTNPIEAVEVVLREKPDVVFLDIEMPGMNGIEAAEKIQGILQDTHIVFVTAFNEYAVKAFELNAVDYLVKPVQRERLKATIQRIPQKVERVLPSVQRGKPQMVCAFQSLSFTKTGEPQENLQVRWRTSKVRGVFAFLLQHNGSFVRKDTLIDVFWPDTDWERAFMQLYSTIYQVRKMMSSIEFDVTITNHENGYRLDLNDVLLDVQEWENGVAEAPDVTSETLPEHRKLMELYRGDYLLEEDYLWAENERERLRILWLQHISKVAIYLESVHEFGDAISLYLHVQQSQPYVDQSYFKLMQLYNRIGDLRSVEQQYEQLRKMLREEYNTTAREGIQEWFDEWVESKDSSSVVKK